MAGVPLPQRFLRVSSVGFSDMIYRRRIRGYGRLPVRPAYGEVLGKKE